MKKANRIAFVLTPLALGLFAASASAADRVDLFQLDLDRLSETYRSATRGLPAAPNALQRHAELIGLDSSSSLQVLGTETDVDGTQHIRYQQTFRGIPVWGEHVIVAQDRFGNVRSLSGRMVHGLENEIVARSAAISAETAAGIARAQSLGARVSAMTVERQTSEQMIYVGDDDRAHLAYVVSFFADSKGGGNPTRPFTIVDAQSGVVLSRWEGLTHAAIGTGPGGNAKTGQYEWGSGGRYGFNDVTQSGTSCAMNNASVKTVNLNHGSSGTTAYSYACPRNTVKTINGAYSPLNDAHYFGGAITKMYPAYTTYNALSFQLVMRVHYSSSYENAFWDGSTMSFGDGASTFHPLVSVDVAGHEVSHGFTEQHSNLTYSGQSGGMNEAFSDMGGEATEYYWKGSNDFLVGPEVFKAAGALRYMNNPPQDGSSIDNASQYTSGLDVHYSSGVYNKAFYLLATKPGWNVPSAFKVFTRANAVYWTPSSTFNSGACGVESSATDLGLVKADVTAAFASVGVSCSGGGGGGGGSTGGPLAKGVPVTGINQTTGNSVNYTLAVPAGATNLTFTLSGGTGDADMYVRFGSAPTDTTYDCRPYLSGNNETCSVAAPSAGTYHVRLKAYSTFSGASLVANYTTGGGGGGTQTYTNGTDVNIPDNNATGVTSSITVSGRTGNGQASTPVQVNIVHPYIGDLIVDLVAPDGSVYNIHNRTGGSADNINKTVNINLSGEALNGTWRLRAADRAAADVGYINSWSVTF